MAIHGYSRHANESARHFAKRINSSRDDLVNEVNGITSLFNKLRYSAHPPGYLYEKLERAIKNFQPKRIR
jgi:hypothetical protein